MQVTVKDLHIQIDKYDRRAAVTTTGEGSVVIELDGSNDLIAGADYAGLQKENGGTLTIQDADNDGSLIAKGGDRGAGIGGGDDGAGTNITITGGTVTATGGEAGAGIGGGDDGAGTNITITGGTVTATGGVAGAGIGGGSGGNGTGITIEDGTVTANGGVGGAGTGGGDTGSGTDINITGGTVVATGGSRGAGIGAGGGTDEVGSDITISGGTVVAVSMEVGAGIGGGSSGTAGDITVSGGAQVSVAGGEIYIGQYYTIGSGAGIGNGGRQNNDPAGDPIPGQEAAPHTEGLTTGHIYYYETGTTADEIRDQENPAKPEKVVCGSQGHTPGEPQKENEVAGDCATDGGYDQVIYCAICGDELIRQFVNTGKVADAHDWVVDEAVPPSCTETGLTEGKHCSRCTAKVEQQVVPANGHQPAAPVKENEVAATDFTEGSYDLVVYCSVCHVELSRETVTVPALLDPFSQYCQRLAYRIRTAPENGTVETDAGDYTGLQRVVFEALADRPDVTLKITCRVDGQRTELIVPAGTDLLTPLGKGWGLTFADMAKLLA